MTETRGFAVGDRVIARRNDHRLGIANGHAGRLTAVGGERLNVALDDGRELELPGAYVRAGHLDHGYALTAHLAQGSTVDRAFVLGSDELYREWGYTALSRHRSEARFYVSATPAFLNRAAEPLTDVTGAVTRMLADSRAQHAALSGLGRPSSMADLARAQAQLAEIDIRLEGLRSQRAGVRWYQRANRIELDRVADGWLRSRAHWHREVERLGSEVAKAAPPVVRAADPLARFNRATRSVRRERDTGRDLGLDR